MAQGDREYRHRQQTRDAPHLQDNSRDNDSRTHVRALVPPGALFSDRVPGTVFAELRSIFSRTPRPRAELTAPSSIISIPASLNAAINLTSESTLPRTIVSLASMR